MKYVCDVCGWEYDEEVGYPEGGIAPGTKWEDVPEDFECPLCNVGKDQFSEVEQKPNLVLNTCLLYTSPSPRDIVSNFNRIFLDFKKYVEYKVYSVTTIKSGS